MYTDKRLQYLLPSIRHAMDKLDLTDEDIKSVEMVDKGLISIETSEGKDNVSACFDFNIPYGWNFNTGYFVGDLMKGNIPYPTIYLSRFNLKTRELFTPDQYLAAWLHETKHAHQYKTNKDLFYTKKPAEEDADAFAIAFMEACTSYDPDSYLWLIRRFMARDHGARRRLADQMLTKYF